MNHRLGNIFVDIHTTLCDNIYMVTNLRGDVLQAQTEWAASQEAYIKGKSLAEQSGHYQVAAEA